MTMTTRSRPPLRGTGAWRINLALEPILAQDRVLLQQASFAAHATPEEEAYYRAAMDLTRAGCRRMGVRWTYEPVDGRGGLLHLRSEEAQRTVQVRATWPKTGP